ncbi:MAG: 23S rRNA (guanosine(2251)-2'-O)-methyltransferase RlmB [Firmicutes bacterium]|nr:23S rRNA (guanosine(2251)-2'-O)-methyltransferase RlmB [Bacillota bacterium]MCL2770991.1 23S rRNA (guanosine(2251)-2'-O)-methyltransferase RlmB [Bacillota bacterium]
MKIFGKHSVLETLRNKDITVLKVLMQEGLKGTEYNAIHGVAKARGIKVQTVNRAALDAEFRGLNHQGVMAETTSYKYFNIKDILEVAEKRKEDAFILVLNEVTDVHNLASMIRTAEALGVHGIILSKNRNAQVNETVLKISAGAASHVKIALVGNLTGAIEDIKKQGIFVFGAELGGGNIYKTNLKGKIAIVIGSEGEGIKEHVKKACDGIITIPQTGKVNSLNAGVAAGICLAEVVRQRQL